MYRSISYPRFNSVDVAKRGYGSAWKNDVAAVLFKVNSSSGQIAFVNLKADINYTGVSFGFGSSFYHL